MDPTAIPTPVGPIIFSAPDPNIWIALVQALAKRSDGSFTIIVCTALIIAGGLLVLAILRGYHISGMGSMTAIQGQLTGVKNDVADLGRDVNSKIAEVVVRVVKVEARQNELADGHEELAEGHKELKENDEQIKAKLSDLDTKVSTIIRRTDVHPVPPIEEKRRELPGQ